MVDQFPSGVCIILMCRATASVYGDLGTLLVPKSKSSHATLPTVTTFKSMIRSGEAIIDCGNCAISRGAGMPFSRTVAAAADTRSCAWHELQPPMRMKLWLCCARCGIAFSIAACGDLAADTACTGAALSPLIATFG